MKIIKKIINVLATLIIVIGGIFLGLYIFGIVPYVILSGSMEPTIETGSLCFVNKNISIKDIKQKDIIAFKLDDGTLVTHRVVKINDDGIRTKGDNNKKMDEVIITKDNYVGKNIFWISKIGYVVMIFQTTNGKIILISFVILLFVFGLLFGDNKKEKDN